MKKRIITILLVVFAIAFVAEAQLPKPPTGTKQTTDNKTATVRDSAVQGPVGTATALLVTLGAGAVAYKVRKNKKEED
ncbi:MAG: hypothetical protein IJR03_01285 [Bacteroidales bacterium]|nr:hypothetical protein [Bacteroidales bacterium]